nr:FG-GAP-like repeat-containing protein [Lacunisphaera limnophila]
MRFSGLILGWFGLAPWALPSTGVVAEPLAVRSAPRGATLFATMPAAQTGIVAENRYADPRMWKEKFQEFKFGAMGTGVAVGDFDGDGRVDLFVVSKTEASRLFRNLGGWKFEEVTVQAGISEPGKPAGWTQGAAFADVDNDGRLDLYLSRFGVPNLLFMNRGDGTFREEAAARGLAVVDASGQAAFCDYDRDGDLDVYVQTNLLDTVKAPQGQPDYLFRNRGDGTFENVTMTAGMAGGETAGHSATWWDHDEDGWPDLYVANDYAVPDFLYRNNRDGTFTDVIGRAVDQTPHSSMGADLGDVDNDGRADLLVADMATSTREKDQRGTAKIRAMLDTAVHPPGVFQYMRSMLYLGTGTARLREGAWLAGMAGTDWTWSPRFEDFDNDGRLDLHVTNGMVRELHNADLVQDISASESLEAGMRLEKAAPVFAERNLAYRNQGGLAFEEVGVAWGLGQVGVSFGSATGDFDGDGDLDLVYGNYEAGPTVLRNDSDTGHRLVVALRGTTSNRFGVGATVRVESALGRQVRTLVLARGYLSTSEPVLHFGLGKDEVIKTLTVEWPSGHRQRFTNLSADQKLTITEPAGPARPEAPVQPSALFTAQTLELQAREQPETDSNPQALLPFRFDRRGPALAVLPKDGREQLLLGGTTKDPLTGFALADALDDGPLLVFEANGDGLPDLLQTKAGTSRPMGADYQPKLHLGTATGFTSAPLPALPQSTGAVTAADFDRDGDLDVFLGARVLPGKYPLPPRSVLLRNDGGRFSEMPLPQNGELGLITSASFSDLDADGWPDLLLATEWGPVVYLHNEQGLGFTDRSAAQGFSASGFWASIVAADFNGDGRPDYAVGNAGLNTPYREGPAYLFHGRFGDGGPPQVIEAVQENNQLYPRRTRNELGPRVAGLLRRFPRHNDYAKATLTEVLGAERLAKARRFDATELRSGLYLSQPVGPHRFVALPWEVQLAPVQGMVALDVTGDGHVDLALVQNSHAPAPSLGRFSGGVGLLLAGDGRGGFRALDPQTSGLLVPGDAKALVVTDRNADGWPDLVASRNDESALAFLHRGVAGQQPLRVVLQGPAGNPTAIGATVTLTLADGSTRTAAITAGSGYYSQSSPAVFFSYPSATPARAFTVTWSDGTSSTHAIEPNGGIMHTLVHPR